MINLFKAFKVIDSVYSFIQSNFYIIIKHILLKINKNLISIIIDIIFN